MKVAIIGANGQLGSDLANSFSNENEVVSLNHNDIEVSDIDQVNRVLLAIRPHVVINTSAFHQVPLCEQNPDLAFAINAKGVLNLAKCASGINAKFVHYSTDYVFDGLKKQSYHETDYCNPLNVYGSSKLAGESLALNYSEHSFVIRISGIYGKVPCRAKGGNFITTMLRLASEKTEVRVVNDEILTPTPTTAIAENTLKLVTSDAYGLYHMTSEGQCSWYEFAAAIWKIMRLKTPLLPSSVHDAPIAVRRPFYSVLENSMLEKNGINFMPDWETALHDFLKPQA